MDLSCVLAFLFGDTFLPPLFIRVSPVLDVKLYGLLNILSSSLFFEIGDAADTGDAPLDSPRFDEPRVLPRGFLGSFVLT